MPAPIRISAEEGELAELARSYEESPDPETRSRYQMVLLAAQSKTAYEIAPMVLRSPDTVQRVLRRYLDGGTDAVPRKSPPGGQRVVTPEWEAGLLGVIGLSPREVGVGSANWTTGLLAEYLAGRTGVAVGAETVRHYLHANGYVCKRSTWTLARKAAEQPGWEGKG